MLRGVFGSRHRPRQAAVGGAELTSTSISDERFSVVGAAVVSVLASAPIRYPPVTELGFVTTIIAAADIEELERNPALMSKVCNISGSAASRLASAATVGG